MTKEQNLRKKYREINPKTLSQFTSSFKDEYEKEEIEKFYFKEKSRIKQRNSDYEKTRIKKTISFTNKEFEKVEEQQKKTDLDFSSFVKSVLLKRKISSSIDRELLIELNRIGNNINQIAKGVNSNSLEYKSILITLNEIQKEIKELK